MGTYYVIEYRTQGGIGALDKVHDGPEPLLAAAPNLDFAAAHRLFIVRVTWEPNRYERQALYRWHPSLGWRPVNI